MSHFKMSYFRDSCHFPHDSRSDNRHKLRGLRFFLVLGSCGCAHALRSRSLRRSHLSASSSSCVETLLHHPETALPPCLFIHHSKRSPRSAQAKPAWTAEQPSCTLGSLPPRGRPGYSYEPYSSASGGSFFILLHITVQYFANTFWVYLSFVVYLPPGPGPHRVYIHLS